MSVLQESPTEYQAKPDNFTLPTDHLRSYTQIAGFKSGQARRSISEKAKAFDALAVQLLPNVQQVLSQPTEPNPKHVRQIELLCEQIQRIDTLIAQEVNAKGMQALCQAKSKLFEIYAHLAGIPKPMAGREPRQSQRRVSLTPIDIDLPQVPKLPEPTPTIPEPLHHLPGDVTP